MVSVVDLYKKYRDDIYAVVDLSLQNYTEGQTAYDKIIPLRNFQTLQDALLMFKTSLPVMASIVAPEQELPQSRRQEELSLRTIERLKIGRQIIYGARELEDLAERRRYDILIPGRNSLPRTVLDNAAEITESIVLKHTFLTTKAISQATVTYVDELTTKVWALAYPDTLPELLPAALTGTARWSQAATATGLADLRAHAEAFYNVPYFRKFPDNLLIHRKQIRELAAQISTKRIFIQRGGGSLTGVVDADLATLFLEDQQVIDLIKAVSQITGDVIIFDAVAGAPQLDGTVIQQQLLPDDTYTFVENGNVIRAVVPTIEKATPQGVPVPGIYVAAKVIDDAPRVERIAGVANGFPLIIDSRKLAARKVN